MAQNIYRSKYYVLLKLVDAFCNYIIFTLHNCQTFVKSHSTQAYMRVLIVCSGVLDKDRVPHHGTIHP